jgi:hypothetical protein
MTGAAGPSAPALQRMDPLMKLTDATERGRKRVDQ